MSLDPHETKKKLKALWDDKNVTVLDAAGKNYVVMSDIHLGDGGHADDFHGNEEAMVRALKHYAAKGYSLILLGDIEEFWQFDYERVVGRYQKSVYAAIRAFTDARIFRVYGNHDSEWGAPPDPTKRNPPKVDRAPQALKIKAANGKTCVLLVHGHQGSKESDKTSWISRPAVRLFKHVEPVAKFFGWYGHGEATKSMITKDYEKILYQWAKSQKVILICGHSHRAIFASQSYLDKLEREMLKIGVRLRKENLDEKTREKLLDEMERMRKAIADETTKDRTIARIESPTVDPMPCYFNTGCGLYENGLTALEIENDIIRLVKWSRTKSKGSYRELYSKDLALSECAVKVGCK